MRPSTKRLSVKLKCLIIVGAVICIYFTLSYTLLEDMISKSDEDSRNISRTALKLPNVIVHLDMKGSPPKLNYLKSLLPKLQDLGVTGFLMEYEDMFPYEGRLVNLSAKNCYKKQELKEFLTIATRIGFEIIPLVQTFGHMEHVLKLAENEHLREVQNRPDSICPSKSESQILIREMLEQIIKYHSEIFPLKYLHIGCDEVYNINKCNQCLKRNLPNTDIYLNHVKVVIDVVKAIDPETAILIWDDMFRDIPINVWNTINHQVSPVYWEYGPSIKVSHVNMMKYHKKFKNIWVASSFKGADGRATTYPNLRKRFSNNFSWLSTILDYKFGGEKEVFNFEGIILTGWSRYSHMDPPCELLPVSLPSLYLNLLLIKKFKEGIGDNDNYDLSYFYTKHIQDQLSTHLHCDGVVDIDNFDTNLCHYDGNELYETLLKWDLKKSIILNCLGDAKGDLFSVHFYSGTHNINTNTLEHNTDWVNTSIEDVKYIKNKLIKVLSQYYDKLFINEYTDFKLNKTMKILNDLLIDLNEMSKVKYWQRRPY